MTKIVERERTNDETNGPVKAADILAERLPTVAPGSGLKYDAAGHVIKTPPADASTPGGAAKQQNAPAASATMPKAPPTLPATTPTTPKVAPKPKPATSSEAPQQ